MPSGNRAVCDGVHTFPSRRRSKISTLGGSLITWGSVCTVMPTGVSSNSRCFPSKRCHCVFCPRCGGSCVGVMVEVYQPSCCRSTWQMSRKTVGSTIAMGHRRADSCPIPFISERKVNKFGQQPSLRRSWLWFG